MISTVFKMFVKDGCPYCEKARDLILYELKSSLRVVDVLEQPKLHEIVKKETNHKTVPAIYIGEIFIGGCDNLEELLHSGDINVMMLRREIEILKEEIAQLRRSI